MAPKTLVLLRDVAITAGRVPIITSASLEVGEGECVGITGTNGSGKTTLLRVLATLRAPDHGQGQVLGADLGSAQIRSVRPRIGFLGHRSALAPELSLGDNLRFYASLRGSSTHAAEAALETVGLRGAIDRLTANCSTGMLRRADLARLLLYDPELLLLDEPTDGLDQIARPLVAGAIKACLSRNGAVVVVSHDASTLDGTADRVHSIDDGRLSG